MHPRLAARVAAAVAACAMATGLSAGQQPAPAVALSQMALAAPVPIDPELHSGVLPNGLRYSIRRNARPAGQIDLRLVVHAGSFVEDDDQRGVAHLVEHLAFAGTTHFPGHAVEQFLGSIGEGLGRDNNAETSIDDTIYKLRVPTDRPGAFDTALRIVRDWTDALAFDPAAVDAERKVVVEERRSRQNAAARLAAKEVPALFAGSRYADRFDVVGPPESIAQVPLARIQKFYADWYRPDLMTVVLVGDLDAAAVEAAVTSRFRDLSRPRSPRPRPGGDVPAHAAPRYVVAADAETPLTSLVVDEMVPHRPVTTVGDVRADLVERLFIGMLSSRYGAMAQQPASLFTQADALRGASLPRDWDERQVRGTLRGHDAAAGVEALLVEVARVQRFGFSAAELARQKQVVLGAATHDAAEAASRDSGSIADACVQQVLRGTAVVSPVDRLAIDQRVLADIQLADVNAVAAEWLAGTNRTVIVSMPDRADLAPPTEPALSSAMARVDHAAITPYVDPRAPTSLVDRLPPEGTIAATVQRGEGITELKLSNGATVVLKPTTNKLDQVMVSATAQGGFSAASDAELPAVLGVNAIAAAGAGRFNATELHNALAGKPAEVVPLIGPDRDAMAGAGSHRDLDALFQVLYLRLTAPRLDADRFRQLAAQTKALHAAPPAPAALFARTLAETLAQDHPRVLAQDADDPDRWDPDKSMAFYRERFGDASALTFVFVGSFTVDEMLPFVRKYLAVLPSSQTRRPWQDVGVRFPSRFVTKTIDGGTADKAQVALVFDGAISPTPENRVLLTAVATLLASRLTQVLRQRLGATYSVLAASRVDRTPPTTYAITLQWTCDPARADETLTAAMDDVALFRRMMLSDAGLSAFKQALHRQFDNDMQQNPFVLAQLAEAYENGDDPTEIWRLPELYDHLTGRDLMLATQQFLNPYRYVTLVMRPKPNQ